MTGVQTCTLPICVPSPRIHIRSMDTRWGSCLPQKAIITLNRHLLEMPVSCIEYVVLHEFCHFLYPNHSKDFYAILSTLMPDWQQRKKLLDKNAQFEWSQKYETFCGGESWRVYNQQTRKQCLRIYKDHFALQNACWEIPNPFKSAPSRRRLRDGIAE